MTVAEQNSKQVTDKQAQLAHLQKSLDSYLAATDVPGHLGVIAPREGGWSILQITEHLTITEYSMMKRLRESGSNPNPPDRDRDQLIVNAAVDRSNTRKAPEHAHPAGSFTSLLDARAELKKRRLETIAFIEANGEDLRAKWVKHPFSDMDGHQLILLMSNHWVRHIAQIEEIKNSPAYKAALGQKAAS